MKRVVYNALDFYFIQAFVLILHLLFHFLVGQPLAQKIVSHLLVVLYGLCFLQVMTDLHKQIMRALNQWLLTCLAIHDAGAVMVELFFVVYCLHLTLGSVVFLGLGSLDLLDVEVVSEVTYDGLVETWILLLDSPQERLLDLRVQSGLVDLCVELAGCRLRQLR